MLDPDYLLHVSEEAENLSEEIHRYTIKRVVAGIVARLERKEDYVLTARDKWMLETLQEAGHALEDIEAEIASRTKLQMDIIQAAVIDAGTRSLKWDDEVYERAGLEPIDKRYSPWFQRLAERNYKALQSEWNNLTRTHASAAHSVFVRECDKAYNLVATGGVSYTEAIRGAVDEIAKHGITITYDSGRKDTIETATARAVRTAIGQMTGEITETRMEEMEWDIILVSAHLGARYGDGGENYTNHAWWQGKFYSKSGKDKRFLPFSVCGMGEIQGLHGVNCRHSHGPGDGEHNPFKDYDSEENKKAYDLTQKQRAKERAIRKSKREVMAYKAALDTCKNDKLKMDLDMKYQRAAFTLQNRNADYNKFCDANNLPKLSDRLHVAGWDREMANKARGAARRYENAQKKR